MTIPGEQPAPGRRRVRPYAMTGGRTAVLLEPAYRSQPCLQPTVVALDPVVAVAVSAMPCRWQQFLQYNWVDRRLIGGDLDGCDLGRTDGLLEEPPGGLGVPTRRRTRR
jgi:hypothetical protein